MSKNLYRVCKKSDLDEIIKNNFFKPICIIFTTKDTEKEFEDNIAGLFKTLAKQNTYCMHLLINLDNFIDNINFFGEMRLHSPNFITYFKGKQISSFSNTQRNKDLFLSSTTDIINKIHASYIQKLVNSFNEDNTKSKSNVNENNLDNKDNENNEENEEEEGNEENEENEEEEGNEEEVGDEEEEGEDNERNCDSEDDKPVNNIKKRNTDTVDKKEEKSKVDISKVDVNKLDVSKLDVNKVDVSKLDLSKVDISKLDLEQLSIDKKKEKLKELLELKKRVQNN
jgi:hypothetical protein